MKTRTKKLIAVLLIALLVVPVTTSFAERCSYSGGYGEDHEARREKFKEKMDRLSEDLNLTPEQKDQMKAHHKESRQTMEKLRGEMKEYRKALKEELKKENPDRPAIARTVAKMKDVQGRMIDQRVNNFLQMKKILTPEQYQKLSEIREKKKEEWKGKRKRVEDPRGRF